MEQFEAKPRTLHTKLNSKWIIDLNAKCKMIKLTEENIGENLCDLGFGDEFFNIRSLTYERKIDKLDIKIKTLLCERYCQ